MSDGGDESIADLREVEAFAQRRRDYAWKQVRRYGWLDDGLVWVSGVAAGVAALAAALEAAPALTAIVAFASALSTAVAKPVRSKREHAVRSTAEYYDIAWWADQAAKNDPDPTRRWESLRALQRRVYELEKTAAP